MTHHLPPPSMPPPDQWPVLTPPDCTTCGTPDDVTWAGNAIEIATGTDTHVWTCRACRAVFFIPIHHWPVLDGPNCPFCDTPATGWGAIEPDDHGDLWTCEHGHEFVLTPEGLIVLPGDDAEDAA